jgi:hypothetical protein
MPPRLAVLEEHMRGRRYRMRRDAYSRDFSAFEPHVVPSKRNPKYRPFLGLLFFWSAKVCAESCTAN